MEFDISKIVRQDAKHLDNTNNLVYSIGSRTVTVHRAPTQNCQFYSIGCAMKILDFDNFDRIFAVIHGMMMKKRMLIDVPRSYCTKIEKYFGSKDIVFRQDYINSTYSTSMSMFMISTDKLAELSRQIMAENMERQAKETLAAKAAKVTKVNPFPEPTDVPVSDPVVRRRVGRPKKIVDVSDDQAVDTEEPEEDSLVDSDPILGQMIVDQQRMAEDERIYGSAAVNSYNIPW